MDNKTCDLVDELQKREGVEVLRVPPHEWEKVEINGPAIVLIVKD